MTDYDWRQNPQDWRNRRQGGERAVSLFDLPESKEHNGSIPWEEFGIVLERGRCRWCGKPTGKRATWCAVVHESSYRESSYRWRETPCADIVYRWWHGAAALRRAVLKRDLFTCQRCWAKPTITLLGRVVPDISSLHVDHVVPIAAGGKTEWGNLQTLCATCNLRKGRTLAVQAPLPIP